MTYLLISIPFLGLAALIWARNRKLSANPVLVTLISAAVLLVLAAIFDNLMILAQLIEYGSSQNLGLKIGLVPIEDFFYPLFVVLVVSALWPHSGGRK